MGTIQESPLAGWHDKTLHFKKNKYPQSLNPDLPRMFFVSLFVGSRGSGKTYAICQLLKQFESAGFDGKQAMRVILMSPTHDANPVFQSLRSLASNDVISDYTDARLIDVIDDIKNEKAETERYQADAEVYRKYRAGDIDHMTMDEVEALERLGYAPPEAPRFPRGAINFLILDDLVGSTAFKSVGRSALTNLCLKNRHLGINIMIATQNLKAIPKSIRTNTSLFVLFRFASSRIVCDDLYEEVSSTLTLQQFERLYHHATDNGDHEFLTLDFTAHKDKRFKRGFKTVLRLPAF